MRPDADVMRDVEAQLRWAPDVDERDIAVKVNSGTVTLSGFVHDFSQKHLAEVAVKQVKGVTAMANDTQGSEVTLRGTVRSWAEHNEAQYTAWSAPGVTSVLNQLNVRS